MKKIAYIFVLFSLIIYILFCSNAAVEAASFGLLLWYTKILPALLPFAILSYILVSTGLLNQVSNVLHHFIRNIIPVSAGGVYPLIAGFLFGFPLGSRITAQLVAEGKLDYREGNRLFSICNNISPIFISNFILNESLHMPDKTGTTLLILYFPPILYYIIDSWLHSKKNVSFTKKAASRSQINFKIIDAGIMSGFETLTKLGGYIMLFAIIAQMTALIPIQNSILRCLLIGLTEITNGISYISNAHLSIETKYILMVGCTSFGGLSGLAQTASMVKEAGFSMKAYLKTKVCCSLLSVLSALLAIRFLF